MRRALSGSERSPALTPARANRRCHWAGSLVKSIVGCLGPLGKESVALPKNESEARERHGGARHPPKTRRVRGAPHGSTAAGGSTERPDCCVPCSGCGWAPALPGLFSVRK